MNACLTILRRPARLAAGLAVCLTLLPLIGQAQTLPDWTSAQVGSTGAALVCGRPLPQRIADFGLTQAMLSPQRLAAARLSHRLAAA